MENTERTIFGATDYVIFAISMALSAGIGVYFACFGNKKKSEDEYLYGNKKMKAIPVGLSLYSSAISAVSIIGIPAEVYNYGTGYITGTIGIILGMFVIWVVFLPIFCGNLNIKTPYEYFERRFDNKVKLLSSVIYIIHTLLMMPVVLYAPSLALSSATNIHVLICTTTIGGICILYTTFGGFKTVIWTDSLQATLMLFSCLLVAVAGLNKAGGLAEVWEVATAGNRINFFNMDPNPFVRITFWSATIGLTFIHASHSGCSAGALQRYMSLPSQNQAKVSTTVGILGTSLIHIIGGLTGLAMYAIYKNCDPVQDSSNNVKTSNQLVPYFVTQTLDYIPGFSGFFIAGLLSAALSSLSSELNVVGGIVYYDFLMKFCRTKFIESRGTFVMKLIVIINGLIYLMSVPLLLNSKHIYELALTIGGITYGAKLGMLLLGILFPKTNSKGVISGALVSLVVIGWVNFNAHHYEISSYYNMPVSTDSCQRNNATVGLISTSTASSYSEKPALEDIFILYRMSYLYYCLFGTIITIVVGNIVSYLTGPNNVRDMDPLLVAPFLRSYVKNQQKPLIEMMYTKEQQ